MISATSCDILYTSERISVPKHNNMKILVYQSKLCQTPQQILWLPTIDHEEIIILGLYVASGVYMGHVVLSLRVHFFRCSTMDFLPNLYLFCPNVCVPFIILLLSEMKHFWYTCRCVLKKVDNKRLSTQTGISRI